MHRWLSLLLIVYLFFNSPYRAFASRNYRVDSLLNELKEPGPEQRSVLDTLVYEMVLAEMISLDKLSPSLSNSLLLQIAESFLNTGSQKLNEGNYIKALKRFDNAASLFTLLLQDAAREEKKLLLEKLAGAYSNCGLACDLQGNYPDALTYHFKALGIRERSKDIKGIGASHNNIGVVYYYQGNYDGALKHNLLSLKYKRQIEDKRGMANCYLNIGNIHWSKNNLDSALTSYLMAKDLFASIKNKYGVAACLNNMGEIYRKKSDLENAMKSHHESVAIKEEINDIDGIAGSFINMAIISLELNNISSAIEKFKKGLALSKQTGSKSNIKEAYGGLAFADSASGNFKDAYLHYKLYTQYKDSLVNEDKIVESERARNQYEFEKKEAIIKAEQEKKNAIAEEEKHRQEVITYSVSSVLILVLLLALLLFRSYRQKKKANVIISGQKAEVEKSKLIIEEKNKDITDSINYARRIQQARLPLKEQVYSVLPDSFILFKPKDIVSGDFYFFHNDDNKIFIAAADCTGHGVPGAFMSMIGSEKLEEAVRLKKETSEILSYVNRKIKSSLRQSNEEDSTKDGMDIALCAINKNSREIQYSGANRPLWIVREDSDEVEEIKATKTAIGGHTNEEQQFDSHQIRLNPGDSIYIFSDGYADTFGGIHSKKVTTRAFKKLLVEIKKLNMHEQENYLNNFIEEWKAGSEQIDDILVMGVRIP